MRVAGKARAPKGPAFGKEEQLREGVTASFAECPFQVRECGGCFKEKEQLREVNTISFHFRVK